MRQQYQLAQIIMKKKKSKVTKYLRVILHAFAPVQITIILSILKYNTKKKHMNFTLSIPFFSRDLNSEKSVSVVFNKNLLFSQFFFCLIHFHFGLYHSWCYLSYSVSNVWQFHSQHYTQIFH